MNRVFEIGDRVQLDFAMRNVGNVVGRKPSLACHGGWEYSVQWDDGSRGGPLYGRDIKLAPTEDRARER